MIDCEKRENIIRVKSVSQAFRCTNLHDDIPFIQKKHLWIDASLDVWWKLKRNIHKFHVDVEKQKCFAFHGWTKALFNPCPKEETHVWTWEPCWTKKHKHLKRKWRTLLIWRIVQYYPNNDHYFENQLLIISFVFLNKWKISTYIHKWTTWVVYIFM